VGHATVNCPECHEEDGIDDITYEATEHTDREEFWGRPVSVKTIEIDVLNIPKCDSCGYQADDEEAREWIEGELQ